MKKIKYVLCPGEVRSEHDGEIHFVDAPALARLYGVDLSECHIVEDRRSYTPTRMMGWRTDKMIHLYPRSDGNYQMPVMR